ncbi:MAG: hypothetical protein KAI29_27585 [Cyclobacteriaceae bacterium]|nr:hypothetical protein [Cyclobacteriaceae bacterium]
MKKSINICLCLALAFSLSVNISAQSTEKELDQVKLVKQFLGTWVGELGEDSVLHRKGVQLGEGLFFQGEWKTAGKTYFAFHSVIGFTRDKETIVHSVIWSNGNTVQEIGRFVAENKLVMERFRPEMPNHAVGLVEYDFSQPNKMIWRMLRRGEAVTWDPLSKFEITYTKVDD